jgi:hypothetical protein
MPDWSPFFFAVCHTLGAFASASAARWIYLAEKLKRERKDE